MTKRHTRSAGLLVAGAMLLAVAASTPARAETCDRLEPARHRLADRRGGQGPTVSVLHLAMVHGAVYDAVNAIEGRHDPYLGAPHARRWYSKDSAAATAAYRVLVSIVPAQQAGLESKYLASLAAIPEGSAKAGGVAVGEAAAGQMIRARTGDGRFGQFRFPVPAEPQPGEWRPVLPSFVNDPRGLGGHGEAVPARARLPVPHRGAESRSTAGATPGSSPRSSHSARLADRRCRRTRPTWPSSGPSTRWPCGAASSGSSPRPTG